MPDPIILGKPLFMWLGLLAYVLIVLQILVGARILKLPFGWHTRIIWVAIIMIATIHMLYGLGIF